MFQYPIDSEYILKNKRKIKRELLEKSSNRGYLPKKIAILGGSTTKDVKLMLELFLLDFGIRPQFYESEYGRYWEDGMFPNPELEEFKPDIIYIHTSFRNITELPTISDEKNSVEQKIKNQYYHFEQLWQSLCERYHCPIIQNNFERPGYRLLGNKDISDFHGKSHFAEQLNQRFYQYAQEHENFYINDIAYLQAEYGLHKWSDPFYWHMYKYALAVPAIPDLAFNIAKIIKSIYGKNKKAFVLDLDNTLWGGVVGDDGVENLVLGPEAPMGQAYSEFQSYIKEHKQMGILLNIASKNDPENAAAGLGHPDGNLKAEDFISIKANWEPKSENIIAIAQELNILPESMVFVDDNPAERQIVSGQVSGVAVPEIDAVEHYIRSIDGNGYFEVTVSAKEDAKRVQMYQENAERNQLKAAFADYRDYLLALEMKAEIKPFSSVYMARIAQLTNKSNQFNLTTKRYSQTEIEEAADSQEYIDLYGKLEDKFGDNGVVSVVIGRQEGQNCHIELWIMSCRVLKRDMEYAMMDALIEECKKRSIEKIVGYYYPTDKNGMVKDFYFLQGFHKASEGNDGSTVWEYKIEENYQKKNQVITVKEEK